MQPFIVKDKNTGVLYIVLNYERAESEGFSDYYFLADLSVGVMDSIKGTRLMSEYEFVRMANEKDTTIQWERRI